MSWNAVTGQTYHVQFVSPLGSTLWSNLGGTITATSTTAIATDPTGLQKIVEASPGLGDDAWRAQVAGLRTAPPFVVQRLWLDRPVDAGRPAFLGTGGLEPVDNISVVSNYEREAANDMHVATEQAPTAMPSVVVQSTAQRHAANACGVPSIKRSWASAFAKASADKANHTHFDFLCSRSK